jgi:hypothetical protein
MEAIAPAQERIRKEVTVGALEVSRVYESSFQKENTLTAELKQTIETKSFYPAKSVTSSLKDNPFAMADFGFGETEPYIGKETRVTWIDVPLGSTVESVVAKLQALPNANLYKILSSKPILSDNQVYAIKSGVTSLEVIADNQAVRYPKDTPKAGQLVLDANGKSQFRVVNFRAAGSPDADYRDNIPENTFTTAIMARELAGVTSMNATMTGAQEVL